LTKAPAANGGGPALAVRGEIDLATGRVKLDPMSALKGLTLTARPGKSSYEIVLRDAGGRSIRSYPFEPHEISDLPAGQRLATIDEVVPFSRRAESIEISRGDRVLA